ncbi:unnamed protein product [Rotaria socialis]|uniref:G-protein coupled receptors family 1 profile domain-containing protein n=1 Tax=Rotaria socialis TaxID=392032 RepID=A0A818AKL1_9BILA|nr:unnamed protein product [Rotaria socialis]CAF3729562.1 unnamed protein product [Rotaria socialis]CAF4364424.1 unnamed protein product [Rotaria socialis]CAF4610334.1 unnamed protein product [Rotaria socialis]
MHFNRSLAVLIFIFGVVGNILNILVLSQRAYRSNPCAWLFLVLSIVNLASLISGLITIMIDGWTTNPTDYMGWLCKLRAFLVFSTRTIAMWLMVLATADRWLLSSINAHRRQHSSLKNAQLWTAIIVILSFALYSQQLYCYEANLMDTPLKCYGKTVACRFLTDLSLALVTVLIPIFLMILFGSLIISNVRQSQRRIHTLQLGSTGVATKRPLGSHGENSVGKFRQKTDRSLLRILFSQVILIGIFTLPLCFAKFYLSFWDDHGSQLVLAANVFVYDLAILIYDISNGITFYVYTLCGGTVFRKALYDFIMSMKLKMRCH